MRAEALDQALDADIDPRSLARSPSRSAVEPIGRGIHDAVYECAVARARRHGLLDAEGRLSCCHCHHYCPWHVSLCCEPCREEERRTRPERRQREIEAQRAEQRRQAEQPRPAARVRSFRDGY